MQKKLFISGLTLALAAVQVDASQSLLETYEQAIKNDTTLKIAQYQVDSAQQDVTTGFSKVLPTVTASSSYGVYSESTSDGSESLGLDFDAQNFGATLTVSQNIFALAAFTGYEAVKVNASIVDIEAAYAEQDLMVRVAEAYINGLRAKDALQVAKAQLEAVERQYEQTQQRYDVGLVAITDVLDATATLDETKVALIRAESSYDIALQNISIITGQAPDDILSISEDIPVSIPEDDGQQLWIDHAVSKHPDILVAEKNIEVGELTLKGTRENLTYPTVTGSAYVDYDDYFTGTDNDDEQNWTVGVSLSASFDLYTGGGNSAELAKLGISNNILEQQLELLKRSKAVTVANLYRTVQADAQNVDAQKQALKSRESALQATEVGYDVGTRNIVEVLNSQLALYSAQNDLNNARYDYLVDLLNLKMEAGQLSLADLQSIEDYMLAE
ncbi:TolC family outer membrane protein [Reinekea marinisedimentorum]|uniref:Outer membrane protein n=1 Tax=Reinekea marinisedimentorum TaxID=230495 RepID=A0A4R3I5C4_9GAMM|nr:TolC family outer membrane protein [Reinekea marinisedimentorum]TCS41163.1 outer membrane protein [Reinekea marinisedimentorum]